MWIKRKTYDDIFNDVHDLALEVEVLKQERDDLSKRAEEMAVRLDVILLAANPASGYAHECSETECTSSIVSAH
jgi:hypothetical protein